MGDMCGGLLDIHKQTREFSNLSEARMQVRASRAKAIPQVIQQRVQGQWLRIQLIPQISTPQITPKLTQS